MTNHYACEWCNTDYGVFSDRWYCIDDAEIRWFMCPPCQKRWHNNGLYLAPLYRSV